MKQNISGPLATALIAVAVIVAAGIFYFGFVRERKGTPEEMRANMQRGMAQQEAMRQRYQQQMGGRERASQPSTSGP